MMLSGLLISNQGPVEGFISIDGYHGAPGILVGPDGKFKVDIDDESVQDKDFTVYVFGKGWPGGPEIPVNFVRLGSVYIEINVETRFYTIQSV